MTILMTAAPFLSSGSTGQSSRPKQVSFTIDTTYFNHVDIVFTATRYPYGIVGYQLKARKVHIPSNSSFQIFKTATFGNIFFG